MFFFSDWLYFNISLSSLKFYILHNFLKSYFYFISMEQKITKSTLDDSS
ncbi:hypothetical protein HMPREF0813_00839 [Streptococcus anginosus F0211]|uniref:Uncharacterized protein n=1 Tax=Streptococcus anginosus F0211 TaxID=706437 RepID=E6J0R6_STRAP|nr:hypothetical protein SanJ4206_0183c [Streptococcus anginosus]EFU22524.1 hypothetical protein HMPREF0813_00839 [Streptococcus anginosus F0211]ETS97295.1 hypothetical protein HMPREF1512_0697 [Streptococcus sp. OBRC6]EUB13073.1 hypothetical protein HMPREF1510_1430 [Streptococcus sp. ACC21]EUC75786.1 hypothetical protein HMPREF1511_0153 [Streptococcus sp. CM7]EWC98799.1 hypothetical protein HMPREF1509_0862 [Streptococcus sp. AC15]